MVEPLQAGAMIRQLVTLALIAALSLSAPGASAQEEHPLVAAAGDGNLAGVRALLDRGADPNEADESQTTALMAASWGGHVEVVRALLDAGAHLDEGDESQTTALMAASLGGHLSVVELLLERGADLRIRDVDGDDALGFAVYGGSTEIARALLERGADPNGTNEIGQTPLLIAAQGEVTDLLHLLLERGADLEARDQDGDGALAHAALGGSAEAALFLLDRGADPNRANHAGAPPLFHAAASGNVAVVRVLLDRGADVAVVDDEGNTALHQAARTGATDAMMALIDRGADVNAEARGWTAWMIAAAQFDTATAEALATRGAAHDEALRTALERTTEAAGWAQGMRIPMALTGLADARRLAPDLPISGAILNVVCWNGTLIGHAERVAEACEEAVGVLPEPSVRDSRGLNRAVRGDLSGALGDFRSFAADTGVEGRELRAQWIAELERGTNPITPAVLESLRYPWLPGSAIATSRHLGYDLIAMVPGLADVPDSALVSQEVPYQTSGFQRVFSAGGTSFGWGSARLSGVVFNVTLMGGERLAESGVADIADLSEEAFREGFVPALSQSMGFDPDSATVARVSLGEFEAPRTAWRIGAPIPMDPEVAGADTPRRMDVHLIFFARRRIVGTCLIVSIDELRSEDVVRIVRVFETTIVRALPNS